VRAALAGLPVRPVLNPRYAEGQSTSLRAGIDALSADAEAVVVALGDQPLPDPIVVGLLVEAFRRTGQPVVVTRYRPERGHPVLFARSVFDELRAITGDQGGRSVIARDPGRVAEVAVDAPVPPDVDTWADYEALRRAAGGPPG
jgi:molybdenum cofactor cytidylyltransferase